MPTEVKPLKTLTRLKTEHQEKRKTSAVTTTNREREIVALGKFVIIFFASLGITVSIWIALDKLL